MMWPPPKPAQPSPVPSAGPAAPAAVEKAPPAPPNYFAITMKDSMMYTTGLGTVLGKIITRMILLNLFIDFQM